MKSIVFTFIIVGISSTNAEGMLVKCLNFYRIPKVNMTIYEFNSSCPTVSQEIVHCIIFTVNIQYILVSVFLFKLFLESNY